MMRTVLRLVLLMKQYDAMTIRRWNQLIASSFIVIASTLASAIDFRLVLILIDEWIDLDEEIGVASDLRKNRPSHIFLEQSGSVYCRACFYKRKSAEKIFAMIIGMIPNLVKMSQPAKECEVQLLLQVCFFENCLQLYCFSRL